MASFQSSSNITITGGEFKTYVYGNLVQCGHLEQKETTEPGSEQYRIIPTGNVRLQRTIADTVVERDDIEEWGSLKARRRISVARIDGEDSEFLHIGYRGPDAIKAYQKDFEEFSHRKNVNSMQLFGHNDWNKLPALVFYDAPVPIANILENNKFSPILRAYVEYQFDATRMSENGPMALNEIWIEPNSGALHKGPFIKKTLPDEWPLHIFGLRSNITSSDDRPFLPLEAYHDPNIILEYLTQLLPARDILRGIGWQWKLTQKPASFEDSVNLLSSLPGTIHRRDNQDIVARWPGGNEDWYYGQSRLQGSIRDIMQDKKVMDDGSVRFTSTLSKMRNLHWFAVAYDLLPAEDAIALCDAWLLQAHRIFSSLRTEEDEQPEYSIFQDFWIGFYCQHCRCRSHSNSHGIVDSTPVYFFIRPVPRPADDKRIWNSWMRRSKYFWSLDSFGSEEMSPSLRHSLGLPTFRLTVRVNHHWWDCDVYRTIGMLYTLKGFDPATMNVAESFNLPLLEIIGDRARFEEVQERQPSILSSRFRARMQWIQRNRSMFPYTSSSRHDSLF